MSAFASKNWIARLIVAFGAALSLAPVSLMAQDDLAAPAPRLGIQASAGVAGLVGDLGSQAGHPVWDIEISTLYRYSKGGHLGGYLGIDLLSFSATQESDGFYYDPGQVDILSFLFIANLCSIGHRHWEACIGLGEGTVNVNSGENRGDFGTWNYHLRAAWLLRSDLSIVATSRFVGRVEQEKDGVPSSFSYWTTQLGLKYSL